MQTNLNEASFCEQKRYSLAEFQAAFSGLHIDQVKGIIRKLKARQMLKKIADFECKNLEKCLAQCIVYG